MSANEQCPSHYDAGAGEQHWDRQWRTHGRGYFVGCATGYVERYHKKGGLEDLKKAIHFLEKLYELEKAAKDGTGPLGAEGKQPTVPYKYGEPENPITINPHPDPSPEEVEKFRQELKEYVYTKDRWLGVMRVAGVRVVTPQEQAASHGYNYHDGALWCPHCGTPHDSFHILDLLNSPLTCAKCGRSLKVGEALPCDKDRDHPSHNFTPATDYEGGEVCLDCGAHSGFPSAKLPCPKAAPSNHVFDTAWGPMPALPLCDYCLDTKVVSDEGCSVPTPCPKCS